MADLLASVVIPVRNRADLLGQCVDHLQAQDMPRDQFEVVVCDDGSTENLAPVVEKSALAGLSIRMVRQPPRGPAAARNLGVRNSSAPIVIFIDSDVWPNATCVSTFVKALRDNPGWVGAEAAVEPTGGEENPLWDAPRSQGGRYLSAAIAYRRDVLLAVGGFDESFELPACEDLELAAHVLKHGPIGYATGALVWHPRRQVNWKTAWRWRRFWRYTMFLAVRHGFLAWPTKKTAWPRLRTALAACVTMPLGRIREALTWITRYPGVGFKALFLAFFDGFCGMVALPDILFTPVPERKNHLLNEKDANAT